MTSRASDDVIATNVAQMIETSAMISIRVWNFTAA